MIILWFKSIDILGILNNWPKKNNFNIKNKKCPLEDCQIIIGANLWKIKKSHEHKKVFFIFYFFHFHKSVNLCVLNSIRVSPCHTCKNSNSCIILGWIPQHSLGRKKHLFIYERAMQQFVYFIPAKLLKSSMFQTIYNTHNNSQKYSNFEL